MARIPLRLELMFLMAVVAAPAWCDPIEEEQRAQDRRLEQRVSLTAPRIQIGELLERLSAQAGVSLDASERDEASDPILFVRLDNISLADALNGLWSLVSFQRATWHWERTGELGAYTYRLRRLLAARQLAARLRDEVQATFEEKAKALIRAMKLNKKERKRFISQEKHLGPALTSERTVSGYRILNTLPEETLLQILRRQKSLNIPLSQLSREAQEFVKSEHRLANPRSLNADGSETPLPLTESLSVFTARDTGSITPDLYIGMGDVGAYGFVGGVPMQRMFQEGLLARWMHPGDRASHALEAKPLPPLEADALPDFGNDPDAELKRKIARNESNVVFRTMARLAERVPLSYMGLLPNRHPGVNTEGPGKTVGEFLRRQFEWPPNLMHKWRGDLLLACHSSWFFDDAEAYPYALAKELRAAAAKEQGFLSLRTLAKAASQLSDAQLRRVAERFPVLDHIQGRRELAALAARYPQIVSAQGQPLNADILAVFQASDTPLKMEAQKATAARVRYVEKLNRFEQPRSRTFYAELLSAGGEPLFRTAILRWQAQPQEPE